MRAYLVTIALLLTAIAPVAGAQTEASAPWTQSDHAADVGVYAGGQAAPSAAGDQNPHLDLTSLTIDDPDEETLVFTLATTAPYKTVARGGSDQWVGTSNVDHIVYFSVPALVGTPVQMLIDVQLLGLHTHNQTEVVTNYNVVSTSLCLVPTTNQGYGQCGFVGRAWVPFTIKDGKLVLTVLKAYLTSGAWEHRNAGAGAASLPLRLYAGNQLTDIRVKTVEDTAPICCPFAGQGGAGPSAAQLVDKLPDAGAAPAYALKFNSVTSDLKLGWAQDAVVAGEDTNVAIQIDNLATHKRLINLSAVVQQTTGAKPWQVSITPSVTLGAGKSTNLTLRVKSPTLGDLTSMFAIIQVRARVVTEPGTLAIYNGYLGAAPALDASRSTFFVHGSNYGSGGLITIPVPLFFYGYSWGQLTRFETEPGFSDTPVTMWRYGSGPVGGGNSYMLNLWSQPIPNAASFRAGQPIKAHFEFEAPGDMQGRLSVNLRFGQETIAQLAQDVPMKSGRNSVELSLPVLASAKRLDPENGTLTMLLQYTTSDLQSQLTGTAQSSSLTLVPKASKFDLPVDREYPAVKVEAPIQISLAGTKDLEAFVNPGRVHVYEFDLRNEDTKTVRVGLDTINVTKDWNAQILPGTKFKLGPNESTHLGIKLQAGEGVAEGAILKFKLVATDQASGLPAAGAWLQAIATRGVDIENETFEVHAEDQKALDTSSHKSPGIEVPLVAALGLLVALASRRRRA